MLHKGLATLSVNVTHFSVNLCCMWYTTFSWTVLVNEEMVLPKFGNIAQCINFREYCEI